MILKNRKKNSHEKQTKTKKLDKHPNETGVEGALRKSRIKLKKLEIKLRKSRLTGNLVIINISLNNPPFF